jgi:HEAT repeat protein
MLSDRDPDVRFHASQSLTKLEGAAVASLVNALGHDEWIVRRQSSDILKKLSRQAAEVTPALRNSLNSDDANIRYWSIKTLCEIKDAQVVPIIKKIFKSAKAEDKICIAGAITGDEIDEEFKELLISGLADGVWNVRKACADALLKLGPAVTGDLLKFLYVQDADKFYWCAKLLGMIKDERAIEPLLEILETADEDRAETAIAALGEIGSRKASSSLIRLLGSASWTIRKTAADALINIGEPVFDELAGLYNSEEAGDDERYWCVRIAGSVKCAGSCELILRALADRKWFVRACACGALADLYEISRPIVEKLYSLRGDKNTEVCRASEHALENIDREKLLAITAEILDSGGGAAPAAYADLIISFWRERGEELKFSRKPEGTKDKARKNIKKICVKKEPADHE